MTHSVLYIVDSLGLSGKTLGLVNLALRLDPARYRAVVASLAPLSGGLVDRLHAGGVPTVHIPCNDGVNAGVVKRLVSLQRQVSPAIVHCFNPRPMLYGGLSAALTSRPAVGSLSAFACMSPDRTYTFLPQPLHTSSQTNRLRNRVVGRLMRKFAVVSRRAGESFCETNAIPSNKVHVIGYGVDIDSFDRVTDEAVAKVRREIGGQPGDVVFGSIGRLVEQKDYPTQLRALALAARHAPIRMAIVGAGPLAKDLAALAAKLSIQDRVTFLGERSDIATLLRAFDAFVLASKFEPFGVALLEAMAAGLPIVATEVNEVPEILDGGRGGMLVPAERPEDLAAALGRIAADVELRANLAGAARAIAMQRFSLSVSVAAYQSLYDDVMKEGPS
ncbi:MAG TPA: glycosyltransferase [Kofleriaceae bacterium]|nr:glycosyltransferase [Kofleriaceae bacterium]